MFQGIEFGSGMVLGVLELVTLWEKWTGYTIDASVDQDQGLCTAME